jgi:hypothetical protein
MRKWLPKEHPHYPPDYDEPTIYAVRAFFAGKANEGQQALVRDWLMYVTGATEEFADLSYRPRDQDATNFAEGKRFVGIQLRKLLTTELTPNARPLVPTAADRANPILAKRAAKRAIAARVSHRKRGK